MARAQATLHYTENGAPVTQNMRVDYFPNSKLVNDFNQTGVFDGARAEVEVIAKGVNFEKQLDSYTNTYLRFIFDAIQTWFKVLHITPVAGIGGKVTTFLVVRSKGGPSGQPV